MLAQFEVAELFLREEIRPACLAHDRAFLNCVAHGVAHPTIKRASIKQRDKAIGLLLCRGVRVRLRLLRWRRKRGRCASGEKRESNEDRRVHARKCTNLHDLFARGLRYYE